MWYVLNQTFTFDVLSRTLTFDYTVSCGRCLNQTFTFDYHILFKAIESVSDRFMRPVSDLRANFGSSSSKCRTSPAEEQVLR
jgi:hypothetical protein